MPDVVAFQTFTFGSEPDTVEIFGLIARTEEIRAATREAGRFIEDRLKAAQSALGDWRGPHSDLFGPEVNRQLEQLGELRDRLERSAATCAAVPDGPGAGGGVAPPRVVHPEPLSSTSSAKPTLLREHATASEAQDAAVDRLAESAKVSDLRAVVHGERMLTQYERAIAASEGKSAAEIDDMRKATTTETTADEFIRLPDVPAVIEGFSARSGGFARWVRQVADAFENADTGMLERLAALGRVAGFDDGKPDLLVAQPGESGKSDVLKLQLRNLPPGMTAAEWAMVFQAAGVGADGRPIHFAIHGWGSNADGAARAIAGRYDARGVDAVVIAVDWDSGRGAGAYLDPRDIARDFDYAEDQAQETGDVFAGALSGLAQAAPDAEVAVTAHSLGNHVAMRGISQYSDPTGQFKVDNYTAIQPAVPDDVADRAEYNGAFGERVEDLTLTINNDDLSLLGYEAQGPEALGDEAYDGDGIEKIRQVRGDQPFTIVDHDSDVGDGHLSLDADGSGIVSTVVGAQVDDAAGLPMVSRDAHEFLRDEYGAGLANDGLLEQPGVRTYIEEQAAKSEPIDEEQLKSLADDAIARNPSILVPS